jgi:hypothetical protein
MTAAFGTLFVLLTVPETPKLPIAQIPNPEKAILSNEAFPLS